MTRPVVSDVAEELYAALATWSDRDGEDTGWALLHFCEAAVGGIQIVEDLARDTPDGKPGWSVLLDFNRIPDYALPWLAQFVGVVIPPGIDAAAMRTLIATEPGRARGRPATIIAAAQTALLGSARVNLIERDTSAYHFKVQTWRAQTPDPAAVVAAVTRATPGGLQFTHEIIPGPTFLEVRASKAGQTFADRKASYPLFSDVQTYVP